MKNECQDQDAQNSKQNKYNGIFPFTLHPIMNLSKECQWKGFFSVNAC